MSNNQGPIIIPTTDGEDILSSQVLGADAELLGSMEGVTAPRNPRLPLEWIEYEVISWDQGTYGDNHGMLPPRLLSTYGKLINFIIPVEQRSIGSITVNCAIIPQKFLKSNVIGKLLSGSATLTGGALPPVINGLQLWTDGWFSVNGGMLRLPEDTVHKFWIAPWSSSWNGTAISSGVSSCVAYGYQKRGG